MDVTTAAKQLFEAVGEWLIECDGNAPPEVLQAHEALRVALAAQQ